MPADEEAAKEENEVEEEEGMVSGGFKKGLWCVV